MAGWNQIAEKKQEQELPVYGPVRMELGCRCELALEPPLDPVKLRNEHLQKMVDIIEREEDRAPDIPVILVNWKRYAKRLIRGEE